MILKYYNKSSRKPTVVSFIFWFTLEVFPIIYTVKMMWKFSDYNSLHTPRYFRASNIYSAKNSWNFSSRYFVTSWFSPNFAREILCKLLPSLSLLLNKLGLPTLSRVGHFPFPTRHKWENGKYMEKWYSGSTRRLK